MATFRAQDSVHWCDAARLRGTAIVFVTPCHGHGFAQSFRNVRHAKDDAVWCLLPAIAAGLPIRSVLSSIFIYKDAIAAQTTLRMYTQLYRVILWWITLLDVVSEKMPQFQTHRQTAVAPSHLAVILGSHMSRLDAWPS